MSKLKDIANLVRFIKNPAKKYVTDNWNQVEEISKDRQKANRLIDAILTEKVEEIKKHFLKGQS